MSSLRLVGLRKTFVRNGRGAVDGIDLDVRDGEVMALLGPSGCGKTTTLQLVAGFLAPDAGEIWAGDRCLSSNRAVVPPERRGMSLVFQSYAVWPHKTVRENVAFGLRLQRASGQALRERVDALLATVRLTEYAERYPAELSGGQQQRVALARAVAVKPAILLLDEPLSNLDPSLRDEMRLEIRRLHDETGVTMLYVTHDRNEAMVAADRIAVLNHGRVEQCGTPAELFERPQTAFVAEFIGRANVLPGIVLEPGVVDCGGNALRAGHGDFTSGDIVALCVQPHRVVLSDLPSAGGIPGTIVRQTYLGDSRDYAIELAGGTRLRATTAPSANFAAGSKVHVVLAADACYVVARSD
ncbi:MAG: ABC transporter ATP-binding protein [Candidatus Eremiobacteraeota bacterium]|nr:ABC transporter ATP-binding protein [Candidatus Eremiobacteraeota bacterium]